MNAVAPITRQSLTMQAEGRAAPGSQATQVEQSRAVAEVQAAVVVAQQCPRSESQALTRADETCRMVEVAERAFFKFPRGGQTVSGPSIHLAVELARVWGNIKYGIRELSRDDGAARSEMLAYAWDVQTNTRAETSFIVPHLRDKRGGPEVLTDMRDIYENNANAGARRLREMIFRVLPPYLIERAKDRCMETLKGGGGKPLAQQRADVLGAFEKIGVSKARIEAKAGPADGWTEIDIANLRVSYASIKRGEISIAEEFPDQAAVVTADALKAQATAPKTASGEPPAPLDASGEPATSPATTQAEQASAGDLFGDWSPWLSTRRQEAASLQSKVDLDAFKQRGEETMNGEDAPAAVLQEFARIYLDALQALPAQRARR